MHIRLSRLPPATLLRSRQPGERSSAVRERVVAARERQIQRQGTTNNLLPQTILSTICELGSPQEMYVESAMSNMKLSARAVHRALRVARTIADLAGASAVSREHLSEAFAHRNPEFTL